jgi:hypothetical protein
MHSGRVGALYKFYFLGWKNGSSQSFPLLQHWLLSIFFYYRQGFAEARKWKLEQLSSEVSQP